MVVASRLSPSTLLHIALPVVLFSFTAFELATYLICSLAFLPCTQQSGPRPLHLSPVHRVHKRRQSESRRVPGSIHGNFLSAQTQTPSTTPPPLSSPFLLSTMTDLPKPHQSSAAQLQSDNATRLESQSPTAPTSTSELARQQISLRAALRQFPDFPIPGIDFVDILPLFASPSLHESLIRALELQVLSSYNGVKPDVIVGLDARGFLFGPSLALTLGAGFAPVRKKGKLPGPTETASFAKEYGQDFFQIQADAVKPGQNVLVVDDIIATGILPIHYLPFTCHRFWLCTGQSLIHDRRICSSSRQTC